MHVCMCACVHVCMYACTCTNYIIKSVAVINLAFSVLAPLYSNCEAVIFHLTFVPLCCFACIFICITGILYRS